MCMCAYIYRLMFLRACGLEMSAFALLGSSSYLFKMLERETIEFSTCFLLTCGEMF